MFGLGWQELIIILGIALVIFGPSKLPELGKSLGKAISGFREGTNRAQNAVSQELEDIKKTINDEDNGK
jgi:TatA/E family protein of Tat protein translocase